MAGPKIGNDTRAVIARSAKSGGGIAKHEIDSIVGRFENDVLKCKSQEEIESFLAEVKDLVSGAPFDTKSKGPEGINHMQARTRFEKFAEAVGEAVEALEDSLSPSLKTQLLQGLDEVANHQIAWNKELEARAQAERQLKSSFESGRPNYDLLGDPPKRK